MHLPVLTGLRQPLLAEGDSTRAAAYFSRLEVGRVSPLPMLPPLISDAVGNVL